MGRSVAGVIGRVRSVRIDCAARDADTREMHERSHSSVGSAPGTAAMNAPSPALQERSEASVAATPPATSDNRTDRWLHRALLVCAGAALFAVAGSVFDPSESEADTHRHEHGAARVGPWTGSATGHAGALVLGDADELWPRGLLRMPALLGVLESPDFRILIHAGDPEPLYTVCTPAGRVLAAELRADEVYREFPMIDPTRLRVDPPDAAEDPPLMLAWPMD